MIKNNYEISLSYQNQQFRFIKIQTTDF